MQVATLRGNESQVGNGSSAPWKWLHASVLDVCSTTGNPWCLGCLTSSGRRTHHHVPGGKVFAMVRPGSSRSPSRFLQFTQGFHPPSRILLMSSDSFPVSSPSARLPEHAEILGDAPPRSQYEEIIAALSEQPSAFAPTEHSIIRTRLGGDRDEDSAGDPSPLTSLTVLPAQSDDANDLVNHQTPELDSTPPTPMERSSSPLTTYLTETTDDMEHSVSTRSFDSPIPVLTPSRNAEADVLRCATAGSPYHTPDVAPEGPDVVTSTSEFNGFPLSHLPSVPSSSPLAVATQTYLPNVPPDVRQLDIRPNNSTTVPSTIISSYNAVQESPSSPPAPQRNAIGSVGSLPPSPVSRNPSTYRQAMSNGATALRLTAPRDARASSGQSSLTTNSKASMSTERSVTSLPPYDDPPRPGGSAARQPCVERQVPTTPTEEYTGIRTPPPEYSPRAFSQSPIPVGSGGLQTARALPYTSLPPPIAVYASSESPSTSTRPPRSTSCRSLWRQLCRIICPCVSCGDLASFDSSSDDP
ncbi:hypothetical protein C8Q73DRAFT_282232 [Cubamyces lactineus]|nr:hypothetical protein C8Q73DRAFT_282232 [Cubamyces lactineus]